MSCFIVYQTEQDGISCNIQKRVFSYEFSSDSDRMRALELAKEFAFGQHSYKNEEHIVEECRLGAYKTVIKLHSS